MFSLPWLWRAYPYTYQYCIMYSRTTLHVVGMLKKPPTNSCTYPSFIVRRVDVTEYYIHTNIFPIVRNLHNGHVATQFGIIKVISLAHIWINYKWLRVIVCLFGDGRSERLLYIVQTRFTHTQCARKVNGWGNTETKMGRHIHLTLSRHRRYYNTHQMSYSK